MKLSFNELSRQSIELTEGKFFSVIREKITQHEDCDIVKKRLPHIAQKSPRILK